MKRCLNILSGWIYWIIVHIKSRNFEYILKNPSDNKVVPQHHLLVSARTPDPGKWAAEAEEAEEDQEKGKCSLIAHSALCLRTSSQPSHASGQTFQHVLFGTFVNAVKSDLEPLCYLRKPPLLHWAPGPSLGSSDSELFPDAKI